MNYFKWIISNFNFLKNNNIYIIKWVSWEIKYFVLYTLLTLFTLNFKYTNNMNVIKDLVLTVKIPPIITAQNGKV